jgi:hypothetical protein
MNFLYEIVISFPVSTVEAGVVPHSTLPSPLRTIHLLQFLQGYVKNPAGTFLAEVGPESPRQSRAGDEWPLLVWGLGGVDCCLISRDIVRSASRIAALSEVTP